MYQCVHSQAFCLRGVSQFQEFVRESLESAVVFIEVVFFFFEEEEEDEELCLIVEAVQICLESSCLLQLFKKTPEIFAVEVVQCVCVCVHVCLCVWLD